VVIAKRFLGFKVIVAFRYDQFDRFAGSLRGGS
jgi:hypothetical protein